jgi:hypothetical protein
VAVTRGTRALTCVTVEAGYVCSLRVALTPNRAYTLLEYAYLTSPTWLSQTRGIVRCRDKKFELLEQLFRSVVSCHNSVILFDTNELLLSNRSRLQ